VKLSSADARAWRENRAQWVSQKGFVLRAVTAEEEAALFPVLRQVERFKQSGTAQVEAVYKVSDPTTGVVREQKVGMEVVAKVTRTGRDQNAFLYDLYVNGNRYVKGRDVLRSRILEKHGECILQGPNGKQIGVLRDPRVNRPSFAESQRQAPSPERCHCKGFKDNPDIGRHHIACEWNMKSPPHERALPIQRDGIERGMMDLHTPIAGMQFELPVAQGGQMLPSPQQAMRTANGRPLTAPNASALPQGGVAAMSVPVVMSGPGTLPSSAMFAPPPPPPPLQTAPQAPEGVIVSHTPQQSVVQRAAQLAQALVSPEQCDNDCRGIAAGTKGWAWPAGRKPEPNQHHPLCKNADAWRAHVTGQKRWMLYDMDRGVELREATPAERAKAEVELSRSGIRSVQVGESLFAVVEAGSNPFGGPSAPSAPAARVRPSPSQGALKPPPAAESAGVTPTVASRPPQPSPKAPSKQPGEMSLEELEAELARRRALATAPSVPEAPTAEAAGEMEGAAGDEAAAGEPTWGDDAVALEEASAFAPQGPEEQPLILPDPSLPQFGESQGLRDARGLVGLQQKDSTIEKGPVLLVEPEPFVDPMEGRGPEIAPLQAL
jgi:hypothetical protein